jgi:GNAT superfamily N-acetyltransferase
MNHATIDIIKASSPNDFDAARSLLARYRRWLEELVGGELATVQPSSLRELADLEHFYEPPSGRLLVATFDGKPSGVVGVHRLDPGVGELKRLYVAPEARGLGIGRDLVVTAVEAAFDLGFDILRLETHAGHMPAAVALYRKLDFRETEPYHSVVGVEEVLTMELWIHCLAGRPSLGFSARRGA